MLNLDIPSTCQIPNLEDIYYTVFGERMSDRFFVEVGAYDGITYSNTWGLAKVGWSGLCVEPIPHLAEQCRGNHKNHPGVIVDEIAVGLGGDVVPIYTNGHELFTLQKDFQKNLVPYMGVHVKTLDSVLDYHSIKEIDLLVIDVEGTELDVLNGFNMSKYRPTLVIIEAHEGHPDPVFSQNAEAINTKMSDWSYFKIYSDPINNIYLDVYGDGY